MCSVECDIGSLPQRFFNALALIQVTETKCVNLLQFAKRWVTPIEVGWSLDIFIPQHIPPKASEVNQINQFDRWVCPTVSWICHESAKPFFMDKIGIHDLIVSDQQSWLLSWHIHASSDLQLKIKRLFSPKRRKHWQFKSVMKINTAGNVSFLINLLSGPPLVITYMGNEARTKNSHGAELVQNAI